ncbi:MAG: hypothetical protein OXH31_03690 [Gammaproteobacteria bacterium]|nr:hypothetical protein [Gammaproteobacteria bacterium]
MERYFNFAVQAHTRKKLLVDSLEQPAHNPDAGFLKIYGTQTYSGDKRRNADILIEFDVVVDDLFGSISTTLK